MKILILSDANSPHTMKWALSLKALGLNIYIFSLFRPQEYILLTYNQKQIPVYHANMQEAVTRNRTANLSKLKYLFALPNLNRILKNIKPDLIHAHYASSYGVLGMLSGYKPFVLSVWGSDVYEFPQKNKVFLWLIRRVLSRADKILSTSRSMAEYICNNIQNTAIQITNFGIDLEIFKPQSLPVSEITIGTIKSIEKHNGIDCLLEAFNILVYKHNYKSIKLLIVGSGTLLSEMQIKARTLKVNDYVEFTGYIPHSNVVKYYHKISIFVSISTRESFGVAVLEASACGIPVITSDVGGLPEVNKNNITGILLPPNNPLKLAAAIKKLIENEDLRKEFGQNGKAMVKNSFNWEKNVKEMQNIYISILENHEN